MKTDTVFYEFFSHQPGELARLLGLEPTQPWTFDSVSVKRLERTIDGMLFCAERTEGPVFVEVQGYMDERFYWRLYNEVTAWWLSRPAKEVRDRSFRAYVLFVDEAHDPKNVPLTPLSPHTLVTMTLREALKTLPSLGLLMVLEPLILESLAELEERLPEYRETIGQLQVSEEERTLIQGLLVQAILTRFPEKGREEVKKMITLTPLRETKVFQEFGEEFKEEGRLEGRKEGRLEGIQSSLLTWWTLRFGPPVEWVSLRLKQCRSLELLSALQEKLFLATSLEEAQAHVKAALGNGT